MHAEHRLQLHRPNTSTQGFGVLTHCTTALLPGSRQSITPYHHQQHLQEQAGKHRPPSHCAQAAVGRPENSGTDTQVSLTPNTQGCGGVDAHSPLPHPSTFLPSPTQTCFFLPTPTKSQSNPTTNRPRRRPLGTKHWTHCCHCSAAQSRCQQQRATVAPA